MSYRLPPLALLAILLAVVAGVLRSRPSESRVLHTPAPHLSAAVNPLIGTQGDGNVFPGATVPFGMVQWSPDTSASGLTRPGGYDYHDLIITGFSLTHLSGAGCSAFQDLPIMPTIRPVRQTPLWNGSPYSDRFLHRDERATPGYYRTRLASGIVTELTATRRSGFGRFTFPATSAARLLFYASGAAGATATRSAATYGTIRIAGRNEVTGSVQGGHFCGLKNTYTVYFDAVFDRPFTTVGSWREGSVHPGSRGSAGRRAGAWVQLDTRRNRTVRMKVGLSYVSSGGARRNLQQEDRGWSFDALAAGAQAAWDRLLSRIRVQGGTADQRAIFYTALYHSLLHPNTFSDVDGRYRGFDGRVHRAGRYTQYANFSGWDIYRTQIPLLAWLLPREASDMIRSLLADAEQGGWLPKWPVAADYTGEMTGDPADAIIAGAYAFGARRFNTGAALHLMVKGATVPGTGRHDYRERPGLALYLRRGYIPGYNPPELLPYGAAATTLEYTLDDFAIAQLADALHRTALADRFLRRSHGWRVLFNPATHLIEPRMDDGAFPVPFDPTGMDGFVEGNARQYLWFAQHDLPYLLRRIGAKTAVIAQLDRFFRRFDAGPQAPYYWAGNETDIEAPWEYDFVGAPGRTQGLIRRILSNRYTTTVGGLPGNDDLGALSAWCVWAMLGMYPITPGTDALALGTPLFPHITVRPEVGRPIQIEAPGASRAPYARSIRVGKRALRESRLRLSELQRAGMITFTPR